jgi:hypothetical protein
MRRRRAFKVLIQTVGVVACFCLALCLIFAGWYVYRYYPRKAMAFEINAPNQPTHVLVASQGSEFKNALVAAVCDRLRAQPVFIKGIDVGDLDGIEIGRWDKVLVINTAMMDVMSGPVRRLVERGEDLDHVMIFVTSGGADFKPADIEVDALSGASRRADVQRLADLVAQWMEGEGRGRWKAGDQVLALEYFLQVDVSAACEAIGLEQRRYRDLYPDLERRLNRVGYELMRRGLMAEALCAFRLNRDLFPESWNVHDSYAEALAASGDRDSAITSYRRSLELNPGHEAGRQRLAELTSS